MKGATVLAVTPLLTSEVNDDVSRSNEGVVAGGRDAHVGVAVEGERIERLVVGKFRPDLDLRREPVLPADAGFDVPRPGAGSLTLYVVEKLTPPGDVVERCRLVVQVKRCGVPVGVAGKSN